MATYKPSPVNHYPYATITVPSSLASKLESLGIYSDELPDEVIREVSQGFHDLLTARIVGGTPTIPELYSVADKTDIRLRVIFSAGITSQASYKAVQEVLASRPFAQLVRETLMDHAASIVKPFEDDEISKDMDVTISFDPRTGKAGILVGAPKCMGNFEGVLKELFSEDDASGDAPGFSDRFGETCSEVLMKTCRKVFIGQESYPLPEGFDNEGYNPTATIDCKFLQNNFSEECIIRALHSPEFIQTVQGMIWTELRDRFSPEEMASSMLVVTHQDPGQKAFDFDSQAEEPRLAA
jgi:hypothetical protein